MFGSQARESSTFGPPMLDILEFSPPISCIDSSFWSLYSYLHPYELSFFLFFIPPFTKISPESLGKKIPQGKKLFPRALPTVCRRSGCRNRNALRLVGHSIMKVSDWSTSPKEKSDRSAPPMEKLICQLLQRRTLIGRPLKWRTVIGPPFLGISLIGRPLHWRSLIGPLTTSLCVLLQNELPVL